MVYRAALWGLDHSGLLRNAAAAATHALRPPTMTSTACGNTSLVLNYDTLDSWNAWFQSALALP